MSLRPLDKTVKKIGVYHETAFNMRHKRLAFLEAMMELEDSLDELVEADETYAGDVVSATEYTFRCSDRRKGEIFNAALDKKLDLTGEKYGRLTVLTPAETSAGAPRGSAAANVAKKLLF